MSLLVLSVSFEYLCYGSTVIINILILSVWGPSLYCLCFYRRPILTYKDGPRAERVKHSELNITAKNITTNKIAAMPFHSFTRWPSVQTVSAQNGQQISYKITSMK